MMIRVMKDTTTNLHKSHRCFGVDQGWNVELDVELNVELKYSSHSSWTDITPSVLLKGFVVLECISTDFLYW